MWCKFSTSSFKSDVPCSFSSSRMWYVYFIHVPIAECCFRLASPPITRNIKLLSHRLCERRHFHVIKLFKTFASLNFLPNRSNTSFSRFLFDTKSFQPCKEDARQPFIICCINFRVSSVFLCRSCSSRNLTFSAMITLHQCSNPLDKRPLVILLNAHCVVNLTRFRKCTKSHQLVNEQRTHLF